jgi:2-polyprenyl-3-methyl-5-hydroxy-6-metoxy-1,4-benzoquinol methylase
MIYNDILEKHGRLQRHHQSREPVSELNGTGGYVSDALPDARRKVMSRYEALAGSYDALTEDVGYRRRAEYLDRIFRRSPSPIRRVADIGCGTGTIACLLAQKGYAVTAADRSEEMLTVAMARGSAGGAGGPAAVRAASGWSSCVCRSRRTP